MSDIEREALIEIYGLMIKTMEDCEYIAEDDTMNGEELLDKLEIRFNRIDDLQDEVTEILFKV